MTRLSEETALDMLDEIMMLNTNIKDLTAVIKKLIDDISPQVGPHKEPEIPEHRHVNSVEAERTFAEEEDEYEEKVHEDDLPEEPESDTHSKKYNYFGPEQYNPSVPIPDCFGRKYNTPECKKVKKQCSWKDLCAEIPKCFITGYGSDDCITKVEECPQAERCSNLHSEETDDDPRTARLQEFGEQVKDLIDN